VQHKQITAVKFQNRHTLVHPSVPAATRVIALEDRMRMNIQELNVSALLINRVLAPATAEVLAFLSAQHLALQKALLFFNKVRLET
jgi:hypothetical protein